MLGKRNFQLLVPILVLTDPTTDFHCAFSPSSSIKEESSKAFEEGDQIVWKPSTHSRRSASLFTDSAAVSLPSGDRCRSGRDNVAKGLVRRFSSPLLSTSYPNRTRFLDGARMARYAFCFLFCVDKFMERFRF